MTKDGNQRGAKDVTTDLVKQLQKDGMVPTWCVAESFLEEEYGRKGEPKPDKSRATTQASPVDTAGQQAPHGSPSVEHLESRGAASQPHSTTMDIEFWKERIVRLEKQVAEEKERHDRIVEKLFSQLAVKDKQISAWDEVTQGLTKALATGKIMPMLQTGNPQRNPEPQPHDAASVRDADVVTEREPTTAPEATTSSSAGKSQRRSARKTSTTAKRTRKKQPTKTTNKKSPPSKPQWYETPTINRLASRLFSR